MKILVLMLIIGSVACVSKKNTHQPAPNGESIVEGEVSGNNQIPSRDEELPTEEDAKNQQENTNYPVDSLRGQETKNGDWSLAIRGRKHLEKAIRLLLINVQRLPETGYIGSEKLEINRASFIRELQIFVKRIQFTTNEAILKMNINEFLFVKKDNKIWPQLKFFLSFGHNPYEPSELYHYLQVALLEDFFKDQSNENAFRKATEFWSLVELDSDFNASCQLKKVVEGQVDINTLKAKADRMITYHFARIIDSQFDSSENYEVPFEKINIYS